jgi:hypothetical protein
VRARPPGNLSISRAGKIGPRRTRMEKLSGRPDCSLTARPTVFLVGRNGVALSIH